MAQSSGTEGRLWWIGSSARIADDAPHRTARTCARGIYCPEYTSDSVQNISAQVSAWTRGRSLRPSITTHVLRHSTSRAPSFPRRATSASTSSVSISRWTRLSCATAWTWPFVGVHLQRHVHPVGRVFDRGATERLTPEPRSAAGIRRLAIDDHGAETAVVHQAYSGLEWVTTVRFFASDAVRARRGRRALAQVLVSRGAGRASRRRMLRSRLPCSRRRCP